jgi:Bacterial antitoxin of type II TA system, VapB
MSSKLAIDGRLMRLIKETQRLGHHQNAKEAVEAALSEYVIKHKQLKILDLFGKIDFDENYDHKLERHRKPKRK